MGKLLTLKLSHSMNSAHFLWEFTKWLQVPYHRLVLFGWPLLPNHFLVTHKEYLWLCSIWWTVQVNISTCEWWCKYGSCSQSSQNTVITSAMHQYSLSLNLPNNYVPLVWHCSGKDLVTHHSIRAWLSI